MKPNWLIAGVGVFGCLLGLAIGGIYKTVPEHGRYPGFYRVNKFTGSVAYCQVDLTSAKTGFGTIITGASCVPAHGS